MSTDSSILLPSRFDVTPHRSDGGGASLAGILQLISILCSVGILLGLIVGFISQWLYLIVIFPIFMGLAVGWVGEKTIERYKIRKPWACGFAGFAAGCLCCLTMHYTGYQRFESSMDEVPPEVREIARHIDEVAAAGDQVPQEVRDLVKQLRADPKALAALQVNGFWDYMKLQAKEGVTITEVGKGGNGLNLGYEGSFIYWGVEALILAAVAFGLMRNAAARPFCVDCQLWKTETPLIETTCPPKPIVDAVRSGDLAALEQVLTKLDPKKCKVGQSTRISTCVCTSCETDQTVEVKVSKVVVSNGHPTESKLVQICYPGESLEALRALAMRVMNPTT